MVLVNKLITGLITPFTLVPSIIGLNVSHLTVDYTEFNINMSVIMRTAVKCSQTIFLKPMDPSIALDLSNATLYAVQEGSVELTHIDIVCDCYVKGTCGKLRMCCYWYIMNPQN